MAFFNDLTDSDDDDEDAEEQDDDDDEDDDDELRFRYLLREIFRSVDLFRRLFVVDSDADDVAMAVDTDPRLEPDVFDFESDMSLSMRF